MMVHVKQGHTAEFDHFISKNAGQQFMENYLVKKTKHVGVKKRRLDKAVVNFIVRHEAHFCG